MFSSKFWRVSPLSQRRGELDVVKDAVKDHLKELKKRVVPPRFMTDEEKAALTKGNSMAMIRANKEVFDYRGVHEKDCFFLGGKVVQILLRKRGARRRRRGSRRRR